ncbi:hypothetical protein BHE74_00024243 [Ensete ventricosum]|nr:hypothetical protein BHE74_00024243 [Ensete ventricosum]
MLHPRFALPSDKALYWTKKREKPGSLVLLFPGPLPDSSPASDSFSPHGEKERGDIKGLSNVKEEVYGALDSFVAWELEFPLIVVKKTLKTLEMEREWKRIVQVHTAKKSTEDGRLEEAEELWMKIFSENLENLPRVFFMKMISLYYDQGMNEKMFEVFADMEELGIRPDTSIVNKLGDVFQKLGMLDKYDKLKRKYARPTWEYRHIKGGGNV